ncbi:MAG: hypothetical protein R3F48_14270 [Candidatus Zixiibacteriota bacterium]
MSKRKFKIDELTSKQIEICQMTFDYFKENGEWPKCRELQIACRKIGNLWELIADINWRILRADDKYNKDCKVKMTIDGIILCQGSEILISAFLTVLTILTNIYITEPNKEKVHFEEILQKSNLDSKICSAACRLLIIENKIARGSSLSHEGYLNSLDLSPEIIIFENVSTIEQYFSLKYQDYTPSEDLDTEIMTMIKSLSTDTLDSSSTDIRFYLNSIFDASKFKQIVDQDINEIEIALQNSLWKSTCLLCGSLSETVLMFAMSKDRKGISKRINGLDSLIQKSIEIGILSKKDANLANYIREARNVIHPKAAVKYGTSDKSSAKASFALLEIICERAYKFINS